MNDLLQNLAVAGGPGARWAGSIENLDGAETGDAGMTGSSRRGGQRMKELALSTNAIDCAALTLPSAGHSRAKLRLQVKGQDAGFVCVRGGRNRHIETHKYKEGSVDMFDIYSAPVNNHVSQAGLI